VNANFLIVSSLILTAISASANPTLVTGVPGNGYLATPTGPTPSVSKLFNFDDLTPNSTVSPAQYSAKGISIASPDGLQVIPMSTQSSPNELFNKSADGSADITIRTPGTSQLGIGIADSDPVTIQLQPLTAAGSGLGLPFSITLSANGSNPGNGYFVISDTTNDIYGLRILQGTGNANYSGLAIDDLQIGVTATPEPASLALLSVGVFLSGVTRLRRRGQPA
jgi:hypothetical protein